jgi:cell filamentation protein
MPSRYADKNGVFLNKLGIADAAELKAAEYALTSRRLVELQSGRASLNVEGFGLDRLRAIHGHLFQDVYAWAGQVRTLSLSKRAENGMTSVFETPERIASSWEKLAEKTNAFAVAKDLSIDQQREQLVSVYVEANRIHPFPEGNGRSLQTFMRQLAGEHGLDLDLVRTNSRDWNLASAVSGTHGRLFEGQYLIAQQSDNEPIRKIFGEIVRPARALAFERWTEAEACGKFPELRGAYSGLRAIEDRARESLAGDAGRVAGYMHQVRLAFVKRLDEGKPLEQARPLAHESTQPRERGQDR